MITQGVQQRSFTYDSLSRVKTATTPEAGRVDYVYNSFSLVTARTDARGVATNYTYDGLNRLTAISYSVPSGVSATSAVNFFYDEGGAAANALGRLTRMTDGVGEESYQYDALGRTTQGTKGINGTPYIIGYGYNWAGEPSAEGQLWADIA